MYRAHHGGAIFVLLEEHKYGGGNNANIWSQLYRHKFDQLLFTANEQIISLNIFSNTFTIQRA